MLKRITNSSQWIIYFVEFIFLSKCIIYLFDRFTNSSDEFFLFEWICNLFERFTNSSKRILLLFERFTNSFERIFYWLELIDFLIHPIESFFFLFEDLFFVPVSKSFIFYRTINFCSNVLLVCPNELFLNYLTSLLRHSLIYTIYKQLSVRYICIPMSNMPRVLQSLCCNFFYYRTVNVYWDSNVSTSNVR